MPRAGSTTSLGTPSPASSAVGTSASPGKQGWRSGDLLQGPQSSRGPRLHATAVSCRSLRSSC